MLNLSTALHKSSAFKRDEAGSPAPPQNHQPRANNLKQLSVNYRWSDIVFDERFSSFAEAINAYGGELVLGDVRAGDRAPDSPLSKYVDKTKTRLQEVFKPTHHTALIFPSTSPSEEVENVLRVLESRAGVVVPIVLTSPDSSATYPCESFVDIDEEAKKAYAVTSNSRKTTIVVVRPDSVVGAYVFSAEGVQKYCSNIFV